MSTHDESRRKFLIGTAAGAVATTLPAAAAEDHAAHAEAGGAGHGAFLNDTESATIAAFAERLMPDAPGKPGAREAGVLNYIDLALAGAYADQQEFYRHGLAELDAYCRKVHNAPFRALDARRQDEVITALEAGKAEGFGWPTAQAFFNALRTHTMEGMFADPIYGGNKDFAGWRLIGFPGAQMLFTRAELQSKRAFTRAPMMGLQAQAKGKP